MPNEGEREIDALLSRCASMICDAQRREVPLDQWTARAHETLGQIYKTLEEREAACQTKLK
jgi:hypothetical protein